MGSNELNPNFKIQTGWPAAYACVQSHFAGRRQDRGAPRSPGFYLLSIIRERKKAMVRAINIPDIEKKKKRRISLSLIKAYLLSNIPT
jgi:hypothetical protein